MDFWISKWISGFLDFRLDFWISNWISADGVRDFSRDGPLGLKIRPLGRERKLPRVGDIASFPSLDFPSLVPRLYPRFFLHHGAHHGHGAILVVWGDSVPAADQRGVQGPEKRDGGVLRHPQAQQDCQATTQPQQLLLHCKDLKNIKNVKGCRDGMPKSMQTR